MIRIHHQDMPASSQCLSIPAHVNYPIVAAQPNTNISEPELHTMRQEKGNRIIEAYANGAWTPAQKRRAIAITLVVLAFLAAIACVAVTALAFHAVLSIILPILAIGFVTGAILGIVHYLCNQKPDLDNPQVRQKETAKVTNMLFNTLAKKFSSEDVIDYDLLSQKITLLIPDDQLKVYVFFKHLLSERNRLIAHQEVLFQGVERLFWEGTEPCRAQRNLCRDQIEGDHAVNISASAGMALLASAAGAPSAPLHVAHHIQAQTSRTIADHSIRQINHRYERAISQWRAWLDEEKRRIYEASVPAFVGLAQLFEQACMNPNAVVQYAGPQG